MRESSAIVIIEYSCAQEMTSSADQTSVQPVHIQTDNSQMPDATSGRSAVHNAGETITAVQLRYVLFWCITVCD